MKKKQKSWLESITMWSGPKKMEGIDSQTAKKYYITFPFSFVNSVYFLGFVYRSQSYQVNFDLVFVLGISRTTCYRHWMTAHWSHHMPPETCLAASTIGNNNHINCKCILKYSNNFKMFTLLYFHSYAALTCCWTMSANISFPAES